MNLHNTIRILMAALVASWGSLWCCCLVKADAQTASQTTQARHVEQNHKPACPLHAKVNENTNTKHCPTSNPSDQNNDQTDCKCGQHTLIEQARDSMRVVSSGAWYSPLVMQPLTIALADASASVHALRPELTDLPPTSRGMSLFSQHCQLTV